MRIIIRSDVSVYSVVLCCVAFVLCCVMLVLCCVVLCSVFQKRSLDAVSLLLQHKADVNTKTHKYGYTLLVRTDTTKRYHTTPHDTTH